MCSIGALSLGEKPFSIREMDNELKISTSSIKHSFHDLEVEGHLISRYGVGSFIADTDRKSMRKEKLAELGKEVGMIVGEANKYDISAEDIIDIIFDQKAGS